MGNSAVQKKPISKPRKPHLSGHKSSSSSRDPQPKRMEEVYGALKQGLEWVLLTCVLWFSFLSSHRSSLSAFTELILTAWITAAQKGCDTAIVPALFWSLCYFLFLSVNIWRYTKQSWINSRPSWKTWRGTPDWWDWIWHHQDAYILIYAASECCKSIDFNEQISWVVKSKAAERNINSPKTNQQLMKHCSIMNYSQCKCCLLI